MIERVAPGGQAGSSSRIENYLGFPAGLSGGDLARRAVAQARRFGAEILTPQHGKKIRLNGQYRVLTLSDDSEINCQVLLITTGVSYRQLEIPGLERLTGAGVYYGSAMTEEMYCRDQDVYIVGAGNSAARRQCIFHDLLVALSSWRVVIRLRKACRNTSLTSSHAHQTLWCSCKRA